VSISETFRPRKTKAQFQEKIAELALELSKRMEKDKLAGRVVMLGLKLTTFFGNTTQKKLPNYINSFEDIY
jgi:nucleotidyltransferase/DNA polymerase involved in DNA repair